MIAQLKTISGLDPERAASPTLTAVEILMAMEETALGGEPLPESLELAPGIANSLISRANQRRMQREFGKWLPKGADKIMAEATKGLESTEDKVASMVWALQRTRDLESWKAEQVKVRRAQNHYAKVETSKSKLTRKWDDAQVYELPPLTKSEGSSLSHQPARYAIRLPDGRYVDLGKTQDGFRPVLRTGPDAAMQSIAKRLGLELRGGAHSILRELTGMDVVPAYTTVWHRNQWLVIIGWQKEAKSTPSSYWLDEAGQLTQKPDGDEPALTLSELDYHLLKGSAETAIEDLRGEVVDYMNEDEELVMQGFMRDESDEDVEVDSYLLTQCAMKMDRLTDLRLGSAIWLLPEFEEALADCVREECAQTGRMARVIARLKREYKRVQTDMLVTNPTRAEMDDLAAYAQEIRLKRDKLVTRRRAMRQRLRDGIADLDSQTTMAPSDAMGRYWYPHESNRMTRMDRLDSVKEAPAVIPGASKCPLNHVPKPELKHADVKPACKVTMMHRLKQGRVALIPTGHTVIRKMIPVVPERPIQARNAPQPLKAKLAAMICEELKGGSSYAHVQKAFNDAFEEALRA